MSIDIYNTVPFAEDLTTQYLLDCANSFVDSLHGHDIEVNNANSVKSINHTAGLDFKLRNPENAEQEKKRINQIIHNLDGKINCEIDAYISNHKRTSQNHDHIFVDMMYTTECKKPEPEPDTKTIIAYRVDRDFFDSRISDFINAYMVSGLQTTFPSQSTVHQIELIFNNGQTKAELFELVDPLYYKRSDDLSDGSVVIVLEFLFKN